MGTKPLLSDKPKTVALSADFVTEKYLQNNIIDFLNTNTGGMFWQNDAVGIRGRKRQNRFRPNGQADVLGVLDGHAIAIEVKTAKGKLSAGQIEFGEKFRRSGGSYYVIRSLEDLSELAKINGWV